MSSISHNKNSAPFKNDILSNMIQKFSEEAKKQFEQSNRLTTKQESPQMKLEENPLSNTFLIDPAEDTKMKFKEDYDNEHYNKFSMANRLVTLNDFKRERQEEMKGSNAFSIQRIIKRNEETNRLVASFRNLTVVKWIEAYMKHISTKMNSIEDMFHKLHGYTFDARNTLCEVKEVTVLDCIQIITAVDIKLTQKKIILTKNNGNHETVGDIIDDYYLRIGDVFMYKIKKDYNSDFIRLNINDIQK